MSSPKSRGDKIEKLHRKIINAEDSQVWEADHKKGDILIESKACLIVNGNGSRSRFKIKASNHRYLLDRNGYYLFSAYRVHGRGVKPYFIYGLPASRVDPVMNGSAVKSLTWNQIFKL